MIISVTILLKEAPDIATVFFRVGDQGFSVFRFGEALFSSGFFYRELDFSGEIAALR